MDDELMRDFGAAKILVAPRSRRLSGGRPARRCRGDALTITLLGLRLPLLPFEIFVLLRHTIDIVVRIGSCRFLEASSSSGRVRRTSCLRRTGVVGPAPLYFFPVVFHVFRATVHTHHGRWFRMRHAYGR